MPASFLPIWSASWNVVPPRFSPVSAAGGGREDENVHLCSSEAGRAPGNSHRLGRARKSGQRNRERPGVLHGGRAVPEAFSEGRRCCPSRRGRHDRGRPARRTANPDLPLLRRPAVLGRTGCSRGCRPRSLTRQAPERGITRKSAGGVAFARYGGEGAGGRG